MRGRRLWSQSREKQEALSGKELHTLKPEVRKDRLSMVKDERESVRLELSALCDGRKPCVAAPIGEHVWIK